MEREKVLEQCTCGNESSSTPSQPLSKRVINDNDAGSGGAGVGCESFVHLPSVPRESTTSHHQLPSTVTSAGAGRRIFPIIPNHYQYGNGVHNDNYFNYRHDSYYGYTNHDSSNFLENFEYSSELLNITKAYSSFSETTPTDDPNVSETFNCCSHDGNINCSPQQLVPLCEDCVNYIINTYDKQTENLKDECIAYKNAVAAEEEQTKILHSALLSTSCNSSSGTTTGEKEETDNSSEDDAATRIATGDIIKAFKDEIKMLTDACDQHEAEYNHLVSLYEQQLIIENNLSAEQENEIEELQNTLEIENKSFEAKTKILSKHVKQQYRELSLLSSNRVKLYSLLYNITIDRKRGLRYPLINDLRLAYKPKGDVTQKEINIAWSSLLQLLLFIAASMDFHTNNWRIVPLITPYGKLIGLPPSTMSPSKAPTNNTTSSSTKETQRQQQRVIYNLGEKEHQLANIVRENKAEDLPYNTNNIKSSQNMARSLTALNSLLFEMVHHVINLRNQPGDNDFNDFQQQRNNNKQLPYEMNARYTIGNHNLRKLIEQQRQHNIDNSSEWSKVIHKMISNVQWLCDCISQHTLKNVRI